MGALTVQASLRREAGRHTVGSVSRARVARARANARGVEYAIGLREARAPKCGAGGSCRRDEGCASFYTA